MYLEVELDEGAVKPTKAHDADGGFDLYSREDALIPARGSYPFDTGVHISIPEGMVGFLKSKSGLNVKYGITSEGVIDAGYTGSIVVKLYNNSDNDYNIKQGNKITQLVFLPIPSITLKEVSKLRSDTERGNNGFGSSGV